MALVSMQQRAIVVTDHMEVLAKFEVAEGAPVRKSRIIFTVSPQCLDPDVLLALLDTGTDVFRVCHHHDGGEFAASAVRLIRCTEAKRPGRHVAILLDLVDSEICTGSLENGGSIAVKAGHELTLVTDWTSEGSAAQIAVSDPRLPSIVRPGQVVACSDGSVLLEVLACGDGQVTARVMADCTLTERMRCTLPNPSTCLEGCIRDLDNFGVLQQVDFVALAGVGSGDHVQHVRELLGDHSQSIGIVSKIEDEAGLRNLDGVVAASDAVMVARSGLSARIPLERVLLVQKAVIQRANALGKPAIVLGHILGSMRWKARPTRAEVSDVANAVLDGADCLTLSEETGEGEFTEATVHVLRRVCEEVEAAAEQGTFADQDQEAADGSLEACVLSAVQSVVQLQAKLLLVLTETGLAARLLARHRLHVPMAAITANSSAARQLRLTRGVSVMLATPGERTDILVSHALRAWQAAGMIGVGDAVVVVHSADDLAQPPGEVITLAAGPDGETLPLSTAPVPEPLLAGGPRVMQARLSLADAAIPMGRASVSKRTKIICTLGPKCWDVPTLVKLIDAGMDVCRLNFSYGNHATYAATIKCIREAAAERPNRTISIQLDTKGPEIRTGLLEDGKPVSLKAESYLKLVTDFSVRGDASRVAVSYRKLPASVQPGNLILCAHGGLTLQVVSCGADYVMCKVLNDFVLEERQNVNLPCTHVDLPVLQLKDRDDLVNFGVQHGVDFVAASYVRSAAEVRHVRSVLGERGRHIKVIAKIENAEGLKCFDEILQESDGIMIARGDLGVEMPLERVVLAQKSIVRKCNAAGKPVITATQIFSSMAASPRPTSAELADAGNAVFDGTDCLMLNAETAVGAFAEQAVQTARRVCEEAEAAIDYGELCPQATAAALLQDVEIEERDPIAASVAETAGNANASLIVVVGDGPTVARQLARHRLPMPILVVSREADGAKELNLLSGVTLARLQLAEGSSEKAEVKAALAEARRRGLLLDGQAAVTLQGGKVEVVSLPRRWSGSLFACLAGASSILRSPRNSPVAAAAAGAAVAGRAVGDAEAAAQTGMDSAETADVVGEQAQEQPPEPQEGMVEPQLEIEPEEVVVEKRPSMVRKLVASMNNDGSHRTQSKTQPQEQAQEGELVEPRREAEPEESALEPQAEAEAEPPQPAVEKRPSLVQRVAASMFPAMQEPQEPAQEQPLEDQQEGELLERQQEAEPEESASEPQVEAEGEPVQKKPSLVAQLVASMFPAFHPEPVTTPSGLQYKVLQQGAGVHSPTVDSKCLCGYACYVSREWPDGAPFASTAEQGGLATVVPSQVIAGWSEAMQLMKEGDKWEVHIPPALGYGDAGKPPCILAGDSLVVVLELVQVDGDTNDTKEDKDSGADLEALELEASTVIGA